MTKTKETMELVKSLKEKAKKDKDAGDITKHTMVQDSILVIPVDMDDDDSIVNPRQYEDKPYWGYVLKPSNGRLLDSGAREPCPVEEGDIILFAAYASTTVRSFGQDFMYIRDEDIVSRYRPS